MKKFVYTTALVITISLLAPQMLVAQTLALGGGQDSGQITIKDAAEFNAYQSAVAQTDPTALANSLESFLKTYPNSVVKNSVTAMSLDAWQGTGNLDKTLDAATRLLAIDANNLKAIFLSVYIKKAQAAQANNNPQLWDDAALLANRGLTLKKPASVKDTDWSKQTLASNMLFHSVLANDKLFSKKDYKGAITEYVAELHLTPQESTADALLDMVQLADALNKPEAKELRNPILSIWFYARVWAFAPDNYKGPIEETLEYWYKKYHGGLDGLDAIKQQAAKAMFPPSTLAIEKAPTPAQQIHKMLSQQMDVNTLALSDKETILAVGDKADADRVWEGMKGKQTPVPGVVIEATTSVIKVAVTDDAKQTKEADFIVNMKTPLAEKDVPAVGFEFKIPSPKEPGTALIGNYASYAQIPASDTTDQAALLVLNDGEIIPAEKRAPVKAAKATKAAKAPAAHRRTGRR